MHKHFVKTIGIALMINAFGIEAIETVPTPDSWSFPQVVESAREVAPKNVEGRVFNQYGLVYFSVEISELDFASMPLNELQKYADIVTHAYPDAVANKLPSSCEEIPVGKLNETAIAGIGYISLHAISDQTRNWAQQCLTTIQSKLAKGQSNGWTSKNGELLENTDSMKSIGGFGGMLLITPDTDWREKWDTPPEVAPSFNTADIVKIGDKLTILIFFIYPGLDPENHVSIDCDIRAIRPDGSFSVKLKDFECASGELKGNPRNVRLSRAVIDFEAEPNDELGDWLIEVTLKDRVSDIEMPLKTKFVLVDSES